MTAADAAAITATNLIYALTNPAPTAPFAPPEGEKMAALKQLASIFASAAPSSQNAKADTPKIRLPQETFEDAPTTSVAPPKVAPKSQVAHNPKKVCSPCLAKKSSNRKAQL